MTATKEKKIENERDTWETPKDLFNNLNKQYNFKYDCCASVENSKCKSFSAITVPFEISTKLNSHPAWMNPPFSKAYDMFKHFFDIVESGVSIYRCDNMETKVWQDVILKNATWILIPKGRISYEGFKGNGSRFPSALIGYNIEVPKYVKGIVLRK